MAAFKNGCDALNMNMPSTVEEKWPYAKLRSRKASYNNHSFKTTSLVKGRYSHGQKLFYKFISNFTNKLVKQLLSMTVR